MASGWRGGSDLVTTAPMGDRYTMLNVRCRRAVFRFFLIVAAIGLLPLSGGASGGETLAIVGGRLIDGKSDRAREEAVVVVRGDTIAAVGGREVIPEGARIVDLGSATILPGMIDAHTHPLMWTDDYQTDHLRHSSAYKALRGLKAVQDCLAAGFTTLRVAGDAEVYFATMEIRKVIEAGLYQGPRITGAGHYLSITGGGGDINFMAPEQQLVADGLVVDGVDEMRRAVRREVKYGSDWIKLLVTGAFMSAGDNPKDVHLSPEELAVAVAEANRLGVPVMAHAHSAEGIVQALEAGVRSIEHGTFIDEEGIRLMVERGAFLVPTIYIGDYYIEERSDSPAQQKMVELTRKYRDEHLTNVNNAIQGGAKIVVGSDFGGFPATINAREFASLVEAGMTPMQAIQAGTRVAAELLGWEDRIGTLEPGKLADVIAVAGDPLEDITELQRVIFVMKDGEVIKTP